jgi:GGDEF domain-containing protein
MAAPCDRDLSVGLATARPQSRSHDYKALAERLIAEADAALYRAKAPGAPGSDVDPRHQLTLSRAALERRSGTRTSALTTP